MLRERLTDVNEERPLAGCPVHPFGVPAEVEASDARERSQRTVGSLWAIPEDRPLICLYLCSDSHFQNADGASTRMPRNGSKIKRS